MRSPGVTAHVVVAPSQLLIDGLYEVLQVEADEHQSTCIKRGPLFSQVCSQQQGRDVFPCAAHRAWHPVFGILLTC